MQSREDALSKRERAELQGYVSPATAAGRALLFVLAIAIIAAIVRRFLPGLIWQVVTAAFGVLLYIRAARWTGGRDLRSRIRRDLDENKAMVHRIRPKEAILFEENEDEGPIVFILDETGETLVFCGQGLARSVRKGFPWREFEIREAPNSRQFFGLQRIGDPLPPIEKPTLSREQYVLLDLDSVTRWQRLDIPFDDLRGVA